MTGMTGENALYEPPEIVIRSEAPEVSARRLIEAVS
jgi:hypothetical protein